MIPKPPVHVATLIVYTGPFFAVLNLTVHRTGLNLPLVQQSGILLLSQLRERFLRLPISRRFLMEIIRIITSLAIF